MQLTPHPVYGRSIALACTGLAHRRGLQFHDHPVTLQGSRDLHAQHHHHGPARLPLPRASLLTRHFYALWLVPGLTLLGVGVGGDRRRRRMLGMLLALRCLLCCCLQPACSSTNTQPPVSGTPAGNVHHHDHRDLGQRHQEQPLR